MKRIDLNADLGEAGDIKGQRAEADILRYVSSANIACGGHAGDDDAMVRTILLCRDLGVTIGAHPAYPDRENFGRRALELGTDISARDLRRSLMAQITRLTEIAAENGVRVSYVKPHGALYNQAVFSKPLAQLIASVVLSLDAALALMGAPGSEMQHAARAAGLSFIPEGFIDRAYDDGGHLVTRGQKGAVLQNDSARTAQALSLCLDRKVTTISGQDLSLKVKTLCLHSDSPGAAATAKSVRRALEDNHVKVEAFT